MEMLFTALSKRLTLYMVVNEFLIFKKEIFRGFCGCIEHASVQLAKLFVFETNMNKILSLRHCNRSCSPQKKKCLD